MAQRGRPRQGGEGVDRLEGTQDAKERLAVIMDTVSGKLTIQQACDQLGIAKSAFYKLREQALKGALENLEPKAMGRPAAVVTPEQERIEELEHELRETRMDLEAAYLREELAVAMPHVLIDREERKRLEQKRKEDVVKKKRKKRKSATARKKNRG
jgi:hypothetical protein